MYIGTKIKEIRKSKNMTQEQFAIEFNISRYSLVNYEKGYRKPPIDLILNISKKYGIDMSKFNEAPKGAACTLNKNDTVLLKNSAIIKKSNKLNKGSENLILETFKHYLTITGYPVNSMNYEEIKELYGKVNEYIDFELFKKGYIKIPGR